MSALQRLEVSSSWRFQMYQCKLKFDWGNRTVSSRGGVRTTEGLVLLYEQRVLLELKCYLWKAVQEVLCNCPQGYIQNFIGGGGGGGYLRFVSACFDLYNSRGDSSWRGKSQCTPPPLCMQPWSIKNSCKYSMCAS